MFPHLLTCADDGTPGWALQQTLRFCIWVNNPPNNDIEAGAVKQPVRARLHCIGQDRRASTDSLLGMVVLTRGWGSARHSYNQYAQPLADMRLIGRL